MFDDSDKVYAAAYSKGTDGVKCSKVKEFNLGKTGLLTYWWTDVDGISNELAKKMEVIKVDFSDQKQIERCSYCDCENSKCLCFPSKIEVKLVSGVVADGVTYQGVILLLIIDAVCCGGWESRLVNCTVDCNKVKRADYIDDILKVYEVIGAKKEWESD